MKSKNDLSVTYMGNLQRAWYASEVVDTQDINSILKEFQTLSGAIHHSLPLLFILDYTAQQYLMMTDAMQSIAGYHPREFIESRLEKLIDVYHKDDFKIFNQHIFSRNTSFLQETPQHEHHQYVFSNSFRFTKQNKKIAQVLQRGTFITSKETGLPLYSIGIVIDITDLKTDSVMVHTIEKTEQKNGVNCKELISTNYFHPNQEDALLTRREKLVLQYLSDGFSSKQISDKLFCK